VVSNHGGRQLDGAPSSIRVLPEIVDAVGDRTELLLDGGVYSGQSLIKAVALGAKAVSLGRAFVWGLGAAGQEGVERALTIISDEADATMALIGERDIGGVGPESIYRDLPQDHARAP
jgi:L-lactate dehydrogenase (cytochrome)